MANPVDDGGPAFPRTPYRVHEQGKEYAEWRGHQDGMSLRDWFAGQLIVKLIELHGTEGTVEYNVVCAYGYADAMITRKRNEEEIYGTD